eukprot:scaffold2292_cov301-Pavlova_lutheri.AAC.6
MERSSCGCCLEWVTLPIIIQVFLLSRMVSNPFPCTRPFSTVHLVCAGGLSWSHPTVLSAGKHARPHRRLQDAVRARMRGRIPWVREEGFVQSERAGAAEIRASFVAEVVRSTFQRRSVDVVGTRGPAQWRRSASGGASEAGEPRKEREEGVSAAGAREWCATAAVGLGRDRFRRRRSRSPGRPGGRGSRGSSAERRQGVEDEQGELQVRGWRGRRREVRNGRTRSEALELAEAFGIGRRRQDEEVIPPLDGTRPPRASPSRKASIHANRERPWRVPCRIQPVHFPSRFTCRNHPHPKVPSGPGQVRTRHASSPTARSRGS